jgi:Transposase DDE domain
MNLNIDFKKHIINYVNTKFPYKYTFTNKLQIYDLDIIVNELFYMLKTGVSYRDYRGPIKRSSLYYHFKFFRDNEIFINVYKQLLDKYFKKNKTSKLKFQLVDTSFIYNINGIENIGRNKYFKNKKCTKLSCITDINGIPISVLINSGNSHDNSFIEKHMKNMYIITNTKKYMCSNRYKQYMLADKGYDSTNVRKILINNGYIPIIDYNKRNTKDPNKIKCLTKKEKIIYNNRIKIENLFCYVKKNKKILLREDKKSNSYLCHVYMALIKVLFIKLFS